MRIRLTAFSVLGALFLIGGHGWSQDKDGARTLLAKAIEAHGGADNLKKWTAVSFKATGKSFGKDKAVIRMTMEIKEDGTERYYGKLESRKDDKPTLDIVYLEEERGYLQRDEEAPRKLTRAEMKFVSQDRYFNSITKLLPLRDPDFKLVELAAEVMVGDRAALGIEVKKQGYGDVTLYFDKFNGFLVKSKVTKKFADKEYQEEYFYSDFQEKEGSKLARKVAVWKDGKLESEWTISGIKLGETFEPATFAPPKP